MSDPRFTSHHVLHYMEPPEGPQRPTRDASRDFEELALDMSHDRESERYSYAYSDDFRELAHDAAVELLLEDPLYPTLKDGDYVVVMLAGTMNYTTYTDFWSGGTECDLNLEPEWHFMRVMKPDERMNFDLDNDLLPIALYTERSNGKWHFPTSQIVLFGRFDPRGALIGFSDVKIS